MMTLGTNFRCSTLLAACLAADAGAWSGLADDRQAPHGAPLDALVGAGAAWALQVGLAWLTVLVALLLVDVARGARTSGGLAAHAGCPAGLRRLLLLACGVAVVGSLAAPSYAEGPGPGGAHERRSPAPVARIDGLPLPDRVDALTRSSAPARPPAARPQPAHPTSPTAPTTRPQRPAPRSDAPGTVVVRPGDCLWSLARDALVDAGDPAPSAADVDRAWRAIYAANLPVVGADPGLVHPGTVLRVPGWLTTHTEQETDR